MIRNVMGHVSATRLTEINQRYLAKNHDRLRLLNNRSKQRAFPLRDNNLQQMLLSQQWRLLDGEKLHMAQVAKNFRLSTNWIEEDKAVSFPPMSALVAHCGDLKWLQGRSRSDPVTTSGHGLGYLRQLRRDSNYFITLKYALNVMAKSPIGFNRLTEDQIQQLHRILQHGFGNGAYRYGDPEIEQEIKRLSDVLHYGDLIPLREYPFLADPRWFEFDYLPSSQIPDALRDLRRWHYQECKSLVMFKDVLHASQFYLRFLWISPFGAGPFSTDNHDIAQILMSYILDYRGYPVPVFTDFHRYHNAVIGAYRGQPELFYDMMVDNLEEEVERDIVQKKLSEFEGL